MMHFAMFAQIYFFSQQQQQKRKIKKKNMSPADISRLFWF